MSEWFLGFVPEAEDDLSKLSISVRVRIIEKLDWLQNNFNAITPLPLTNKWQGFFKLRIGDWRVIYKIDWGKNIILAVVVDHRTRIYKRQKP